MKEKKTTMTTHHVTIGDNHTFALSTPQLELLRRARKKSGSLFVKRGEVRSARALESLGFGVLEDNGGSTLRDGERWLFTVSETGSKATWRGWLTGESPKKLGKRDDVAPAASDSHAVAEAICNDNPAGKMANRDILHEPVVKQALVDGHPYPDFEIVGEMSWSDVCHFIAQGAVNVSEGHTIIEASSKVHRAMNSFCAYVARGMVGKR